jgi:DNA polymerase-4
VKLLEKYGILTIGDIARTNREDLEKLMGKGGAQLWNYANGLDDDPVRCFERREEVKSIGNGMTFPRDLTTLMQLRTGVSMLADEWPPACATTTSSARRFRCI